MQKKNVFTTKIFKFFSLKTTIVSIVIFMLFMIFVLPAASSYSEEMSGSTTSPDMSFFYSADDIYDMAESYGVDGRKSYVLMRFTFDLVWPIVYLAFMLSVLVSLLKGISDNPKLKNLIYIPLLGAVFDYLENIFAAITIARFPLKTPVIAELTPIFSLLKWIALGVGFVLILILIIYRIYKLISKK